jgi:hypothetical protein
MLAACSGAAEPGAAPDPAIRSVSRRSLIAVVETRVSAGQVSDFVRRGGTRRPMKPSAAETRFRERLASAGLSPNALTPSAGVGAMLAYYAEERAEGCDLARSGDMLLFQWGTYEWWGQSPAVEVNITRQLRVADDEETEPQHLRLTFRFAPEAGAAAGAGNRWCEAPEALSEFRLFVDESAAMQTVGGQVPGSVELRYGRV